MEIGRALCSLNEDCLLRVAGVGNGSCLLLAAGVGSEGREVMFSIVEDLCNRFELRPSPVNPVNTCFGWQIWAPYPARGILN